MSATATTLLRSISFSGAGFLACYHIGVSACLLRQGYLLCKGELAGDDAPILTGVSAGALTCGGVSAGVPPENAMQVVLNVVQRTKEAGGRLDALKPGFSLVDQVEDLFLREMKLALGGTRENDYNDYDLDLLMGRIQGGRLLRIGLTNRRVFSPRVRREAYAYVDGYRSVEDILAACVLSSHIPGLTGPALGSRHAENRAVKRAMVLLKEMEQLGLVKNNKGQVINEHLVDDDNDDDAREVYWDGGLVNVWPTIDNDTLVVTPVSGNYSPNPSICPEVTTDSLFPSNFTYRVSGRAQVYLCQENMDTMRRMVLSSDEDVLQDRFAQGYNDAKRYLDRNNLLKVYTEQTESFQVS